MPTNRRKSKLWWTVAVTIILLAIGNVAVWWSKPTSEENYRDAQIRMLKEIMQDIADE